MCAEVALARPSLGFSVGGLGFSVRGLGFSVGCLGAGTSRWWWRHLLRQLSRVRGFDLGFVVQGLGYG